MRNPVHARRFVRTMGFALNVLALLSSSPRDTAAQLPAANKHWVTDGPVYALALGPNHLYLGGEFQLVGPPTGGGLPLSTRTDSLPPAFAEVSGTVRAAITDGAGGWYLGGAFTTVGGRVRANLAHLGADGAVTDWAPMADGEVYALLLRDSTLYAGGLFAGIDGEPRARLAALDARDGRVLPWNPGANGGVRALAANDSTLFAGGAFTQVSGLARGRGAAFDLRTGSLVEWDPMVRDEVRALATDGNRVYVGGVFYGTLAEWWTGSLIALDPVTGLPSGTQVQVDGTVNAIALSATTLYFAGGFGYVGVKPCHGLAALPLSLAANFLWAPKVSGSVETLALSGSYLYVGGGFSSIGSARRFKVARLFLASGAVDEWSPDANGQVHTLALSETEVYVGGEFTSIGGEFRERLASLDTGTGRLTEWNPGADRTVRALVAAGPTVYAGGDFSVAGGLPRDRVAGLDAVTGAPSPWSPDIHEPSEYVDALALGEGVLYAGGKFAAVGAQPRSCLAALDLATGEATPWSPDPDGAVYALAARGATVYAGGDFTHIGGRARRFAAALDAASGAATDWSADAGANVRAFALGPGTVYAGGDFDRISGVSRHSVAALDSATGAAVSPWSDDAGALGTVFALAADGGRLFAGGGFAHLGLEPRAALAELGTGSGLAEFWSPTVVGHIRAVAFGNEALYAGGDFTSPAGVPHQGVAAFGTGPASVADPPAAGEAQLVAGPNPFRSRVGVEFTLQARAEVRLEVLDVAGRRVWSSAPANFPRGRGRFEWDGRRSSGGAAEPGLYFVCVTGPGIRLARRVVLTR